MRVNISYSVELDDIPEKVSELASKEISLMKKELIPSLEDVVNNLTISNGDINRTATAASELQRVGAEIDKIAIKIADCTNILSGFLNAQIQLANQAAQGPVEQTQEEESSEPEVSDAETS